MSIYKRQNIQLIFIFTLFSLLLKVNLTKWILFEEWSFSSLLSEIPIILFVLSIFLLLGRKNTIVPYIGFNVIYSFLLLVFIVYEKYFGSIITLEALHQLDQVGEVSDSVLSLLSPSYLLFFIDIPLLIIGTKWIKKQSSSSSLSVPFKLSLMTISILVSFIFVFINKDTLNELIQAEKMGLFTFQAYTAASLNQDTSNLAISIEELNKLKQVTNQTTHYRGIAEDTNLLILQLEAFQNFPIQLEAYGQEITPNLNKLIGESFYFNEFYQQIGKGNTSDAEFVVNTSVYPLGNEPMSAYLGGKALPSMPRTFKEQLGYKTFTMHVNDVSFWDRNQMYKTLGFDKYYDKKFFGSKDFITLGSSDEQLFKQAIPVFKSTAEDDKHFYAHMISLSGHHPFAIPESKNEHIIDLPKDVEKTNVGQYLRAISYVDYAVGQLISDLKSENLWNKTTLVIYGDHFGLTGSEDEEKKQLESLLGKSYTKDINGFNIPLIIRTPQIKKGVQIDTVGSQLDIYPTVANLFGLDLSQTVYFGHDLLNQTNNTFGMRFYAPAGTFYNNEVIYTYGTSFEDGTAIDRETGKEVKVTESLKADFDKTQKLLNASDAYIKTFK